MDLMMSRKSLITASILITCLLAVATSAMAEETRFSDSASQRERFSIDAWGQSFKSAVKAKNSQEMLNLLDMKALEKSTLTCVDCYTKEKLQTARKLFAKKQFDQSLELYNQITKGTDY